MSTKPSTAEKNGVTLIRLGLESEEFTLTEGATLADLFRKAQVQTEGQVVLIDGKPLEEIIALQAGMTVTLVPKEKQSTINERWRETIGMFKDDPLFKEMVEAGRAIREADRAAARSEAEEDEA